MWTKISCYFYFQDTKVLDEIISELQNEEVYSPCCFRTRNQYFIKIDKKAVEITNASCFADAIFFQVFYVFNLVYPQELKLVYGLIEMILGMPLSFGKSSILSNFYRQINNV